MPLAPPSLLVVDDVPGVGASIQVMLRGRYTVVGVTQAAEARAQLQGPTPFSAILCDVQLVDSTLAELMAWVRQERPALAEKLLVMTGGAFPEDGEANVAAVPRSRRLLKPFSTEELLAALITIDAPPGAQP